MTTTVPLRISILAELSNSGGPLTLADLHAKLGGVSKSAILRWLQNLVDEKTIAKIGDAYALVDTAAYNASSASSDIVNLASMKALASSSARGLSATLYGNKMKRQVQSDEIQAAALGLANSIVRSVYPEIESIASAAKTAEAAKIVDLKFSMVVNFDGTEFLAKESEGLKDLTKTVVGLLSKYGSMSLEEIAKELKLTSVEAYQAIYPLLVTSLAERQVDGRIKLLINVVDEK